MIGKGFASLDRYSWVFYSGQPHLQQRCIRSFLERRRSWFMSFNRFNSRRKLKCNLFVFAVLICRSLLPCVRCVLQKNTHSFSLARRENNATKWEQNFFEADDFSCLVKKGGALVTCIYTWLGTWGNKPITRCTYELSYKLVTNSCNKLRII